MKAVLTSGPTSQYDDRHDRYEFPPIYLKDMQQIVGDWVVFRSTRRTGGDGSYSAVARVSSLSSSPRATWYYAHLSDYEEFALPVPFRHEHGYFETPLNHIPRTSVGRTIQSQSVRPLSEVDFIAIVSAGMSRVLDQEYAIRLQLDADRIDAETQAIIDAAVKGKTERDVVSMLVNRKVREANFRDRVLAAYNETCAATNIRIVNGGGKVEVQAAHIWAVQHGGPDVVQNGIALSGTPHWLFDRYLMTLTDDYGIQVSHNKIPREMMTLIGPRVERIILPRDPKNYPDRRFIARHREMFMAA